MSDTPVRKRKRRRRKQQPWVALAAGLGLVAVLVLAIVTLEAALAPEETEPTEPTALSTVQTLPTNPYSPGDFTYDENGFLTCTAADTRLGIDVSDHQREIDWQQVAQAGIEFAFVRIGYRGYSEGGIYADEYAPRNIENAQANGLDVGVYFYSQALTPGEAVEEAEFCLEFLESYDIQLPVVFDWEYVSTEARTGMMDMQTLTACAIAFCETVRTAGYEAMLYANPDIARNFLDLRQLQDYPFWLALYSDTMDYPHRMDYWQYTAGGTVPGITGNVDINLQFMPGS